VHQHFSIERRFQALLYKTPRLFHAFAEVRQLDAPPDPTRSADQESISESLGVRLRARRKALGLSLRALAATTGVSASFLSQVERGIVSPSIQTLNAVSRALEVPIYHFLLESPDPVVRHDHRRRLIMPNTSVDYELLCPDVHSSMEVSLGRLEPNAISSEEPLAHPTEEFMLVLEGVMDIEIGPRRYVLQPGDAIYYHGVTPHRFFSVGDQDLIFISAVSPPVVGWRPNAG
jgi:transcriptional regulator with XRE-family HTH domain